MLRISLLGFSLSALVLPVLAQAETNAETERIRELIEQLGAEDREVRSHAETRLEELGPTAIPSLVEAMRDPNANVRAGAASVIGVIGPSRAQACVPALVRALQDSETKVRWQVTIALRRFGVTAAPAVPELVRVLLEDPNSDVRRNAAESLGTIGPRASEGVPALITALGDSSGVSEAAVGALGSIGSVAVPALIGALNDANKRTRNPQTEAAEFRHLELNIAGAAAALGEVGADAAPAVPALIRVWENPELDEYTSSPARLALGKIGTDLKRKGYSRILCSESQAASLISPSTNVRPRATSRTRLGVFSLLQPFWAA